MIPSIGKRKKGLWSRIKVAFAGLPPCEQVNLRHSYELGEHRVQVPGEEIPIQLLVGQSGKLLELHPEMPLNGSVRPGLLSYMLLDPDRYFSTIGGFLRIAPGDGLSLGPQDPLQQALFAYPDQVDENHLDIENDAGSLIFQNGAPSSGTCVTPLLKGKERKRLSRQRRESLQRVRDWFGGSIRALPPDEALATLRQVNTLMLREAYRLEGTKDRTGAILRLPEEATPVLVADLHAKTDNLLTVLSQGGVIDALERGEAYLLILGDAVHSEVDGQMEEMEGSMALMDLILKLKLRLPESVFYLRGNHDSFSENISKDGIPQGLLWAKALRDTRGKEYEEEMTLFYSRLPYLAFCRWFMACHAGPPIRRTSLKELSGAGRNPKLVGDLTTNRMARPNRPAGYARGDIERLRKTLGLDKQTPLIVGHNPLGREDTLWMDAGGIKRHHILFSAGEDWVGAMTWVRGTLIPLRYPTESLLPLLESPSASEE